MKYEISDIIQSKYIYGLTILRIHQKANKRVILKIILKILYIQIILYIFYF